MPVDTVVGNVELAAKEPLGVGRVPVQYLVPFLEPVQFFSEPGPECFGVTKRFLVYAGIGNVGLGS